MFGAPASALSHPPPLSVLDILHLRQLCPGVARSCRRRRDGAIGLLGLAAPHPAGRPLLSRRRPRSSVKLSDREIRTRHFGPLTCLALEQRQGRFLLSGGGDGSISVYDLDSGGGGGGGGGGHDRGGAGREAGAEGEGEDESGRQADAAGAGSSNSAASSSSSSSSSSSAVQSASASASASNQQSPGNCTISPRAHRRGRAGRGEAAPPTSVRGAYYDDGGLDDEPGGSFGAKESHWKRVSSLQWYPVDMGLFISSGLDGTVKVRG